ncbi:MAG TPA: DoxX family protein [Flavisolibacter sp.]|nr:DoxX family protein [Flavisolibacter sp.]
MKKLFSTNHSLKNFDLVILLGRVAIASLMLVHGLPKLAMIFSGEPVQFPGVFGMSPEFSLALTVFAEVFCSLLILVGFGTRIATVPLIITMLVAAFYIHGADPFAKQELAIHYLLAYVLLLVTGSGRYSIDYLVQRKPLTKPAYAEVKRR